VGTDARAQMLADWAWSDILLAVASGGIKLVGVDGQSHLFSRHCIRHSTPAYKRILTAFCNPDNLSKAAGVESRDQLLARSKEALGVLAVPAGALVPSSCP